MRSRIALIALFVAGTFVLVTPAAHAQVSAYKTPAAGKWKVQDRFEYTAGGSGTIAKGGKKVTKLAARVGARNADEGSCGSIKQLELAKSMPIKRVGSYKRPVLGRLGKDGVIAPVKATLKVDGERKQGTALVIFEKTGRAAFTVKLEVGTCKLQFAIRK